LNKFLYRNIRPLVIFGHGLSAVFNTLLISRFAGHVWVSLMGVECATNDTIDSCWEYNGIGLVVLCQSFVFGCVYALQFLHCEKEVLQFDSVHQPIIFRIRSSLPVILRSGPALVFKFYQVTLPMYVGLSYFFDLEERLAQSFGGTNTAVVSPYLAVVVAFCLFASIISSVLWEFTRRILEITVSQLPPIALTNAELVDALACKQNPLLRHLGYLQLERRLRYPDMSDESLFLKPQGGQAAWVKVVEECTGALQSIQLTAAPTINMGIPTGLPDYSNRPYFDDPKLVGIGIRPSPGWSSGTLSAPLKQQQGGAAANAHLSGRIDMSVGAKFRRYFGRWALYLQHNDSWFRPKMSFLEAKSRLQHQRDGTFVVHRYVAQPSEKKQFQLGNALTLTVVRDTHPDHEGGTVARSGSTWSGSVVHEQGKGYCLFGAPSSVGANVQYFPSIHKLIHHHNNIPYQIDFAGKQYTLLDTTKPGPMYTAPLLLLTRWVSSLISRIKSLYIFRRLLNTTLDDRGRALWCDFSCVVWGTRSVCFALCATAQPQSGLDARSALVVKDSLDVVVKEMLRTLAALDNYRDTYLKEMALDSGHFAFPTSKTNGRRVPVDTSQLPSQHFGCRHELVASLCRIFSALPDEVTRMLSLFGPKDGLLLRNFLSKESNRLIST